MKSLNYIIIVLVLSFNIIIAQEIVVNEVVPVVAPDFEKIAEIQINTAELAEKMNTQKTIFEFRSKQKTAFINTVNVQDIIKPYMTIAPNEFNSVIIVFENAQGQSVTAAYSEFDPLLTSIPAVFVVDSKNTEKKSQVSLQDNGGEMDMSEVDALFAGDGQQLKIQLQIKTIPVSEKDKMSILGTIIFPKDLNTDRWINNVDVIKIFKYKSQRVPVLKVDEVKPDETVKTKKTKKKK